ncbi:alpha/beta fold hydrolase [Qipengyuania huizhouensis]|uniref:alpha/beta fold hydrolase n=1 Tax=Qipengyuania huizhouensis TaxID=2867245 RepID=UPI001C870CC4|nr:alpha/beta hydrolase [Qipengyuania huizhouensis]MBX7460945.1 alpha/beta hydrolase [Qipengyuania huizhouensis]
MNSEFIERSWQSPDGLELYFRDYAGDDTGKVPVVCLHGLTRNSRDFDALAPHIATLGHRVIVPDMRGRGQSAYAEDSASYAVPTYIADVMALFEQERMKRFISIGTSMGGLMTMLIAQFTPDRIAGAVINDIGPVVDPQGIDKIKTYLGKGGSFPTWMHAARSLEEVHGDSHPTFDTKDWIRMAKRSMTLCNNGRIAFDYDMKIADPFNEADENAVPPDLWPGFEALAGKPLVLVRGALSTILSEETLAEMQRRAPGADIVVVPNAGHAPTLDEPEVRSAIDALLGKVG